MAPKSRLFVRDNKGVRGTRTRYTFLVDTGSDVCVLPRSYAKQLKRDSGHDLYLADGKRVNTYVTQLLELNLGLRRFFRWLFIVADVR